MLNNHVVAIDAGYDSYEQEQDYFHQGGYKFKVFQGGHHDRTAKIQYARDAVGVLVRWTKIEDDFLNALANLKAIVKYGVGYDNIGLAAATKHHVRFSNVQSYANHSVSDHALTLIYACARALPLGQKKLHSAFTKPPGKPIFEFHDKTLDIISLGRIGSTLCKKNVHLFDKILATDPYVSDDHFKKLCAKKQIWTAC